MNRKIRITIVLTVILVLVLCVSGCGKTSYEEISQKVFLDENCISGLMYADGDSLLTSFGKVKKSGNGMITRGFASYDLKSGDLLNTASIVSGYQVRSALPEEDGIICVNYTRNEEKKIVWNVIELKNGESKYVLSGECKNTSELPVLHKFNGGVALLWKDRASKLAGLSMVSDGNTDRLVNIESSQLVNTISDSNDSYAVMYTTGEDKSRSLSISDTSGALKVIPIDGKVQDVCVTKDNVIAVIRQGEEPARYRLLNYSISKDEAETSELSAALYDFSGGDGDKALCHDLDGKVYLIDAENSTLKEIEIPENLEGAQVTFGRIHKDKAVAAFTKDGVCTLYMMEIK